MDPKVDRRAAFPFPPGAGQNQMLEFELLQEFDTGHARRGRLRFRPDGPPVETPVFMPVGTRASVKAVDQADLSEIGFNLILGNTYHLHLRPGEDIIAEQGGLGPFMAWPGYILTDSGGFQVFSLAKLAKFHEDGVRFQSHIDGQRVFFTPENVLDIQGKLGSDIMMVLDDCPPWPASPKRVEESLRRTHAWAKRAADYYRKNFDPERVSCFGIIQGGLDRGLRRRSIEEICSLDFTSFALGGFSVGEPRPLFHEILADSAPLLPADRPRYLMGVGTVPDILAAVDSGVDMFDCVLPTRNARRGSVFTSEGKKNLRNAQFARSGEPLDKNCSCKVCRTYSLAYLRHLFQVGEILALHLATYHNLCFMHSFMSQLRAALEAGEWTSFQARWKNLYPA